MPVNCRQKKNVPFDVQVTLLEITVQQVTSLIIVELLRLEVMRFITIVCQRKDLAFAVLGMYRGVMSR